MGLPSVLEGHPRQITQQLPRLGCRAPHSVGWCAGVLIFFFFVELACFDFPCCSSGTFDFTHRARHQDSCLLVALVDFVVVCADRCDSRVGRAYAPSVGRPATVLLRKALCFEPLLSSLLLLVSQA